MDLPEAHLGHDGLRQLLSTAHLASALALGRLRLLMHNLYTSDQQLQQQRSQRQYDPRQPAVDYPEINGRSAPEKQAQHFLLDTFVAMAAMRKGSWAGQTRPVLRSANEDVTPVVWNTTLSKLQQSTQHKVRIKNMKTKLCVDDGDVWSLMLPCPWRRKC